MWALLDLRNYAGKYGQKMSSEFSVHEISCTPLKSKADPEMPVVGSLDLRRPAHSEI